LTEQRSANGRYRLLEEIGRGGMGIVHRAQDRLTGQIVALKLLHLDAETADQTAADQTLRLDELVALLIREFVALARLRHPHIVSVLDLGFTAAHQPFLVMELVAPASTLLDYGRGASMSARVQCVIDVLGALVYLHRHGIVHRDLKPGNILIGADGQVKVVDFGLASAIGESGRAVGRLRYMAPEALVGGEVTAAADLYAVGIMLYELLIGTHPFDAPSPNLMIARILGTTPDFTLFQRFTTLDAMRAADIPPDARTHKLDQVTLPEYTPASPELMTVPIATPIDAMIAPTAPAPTGMSLGAIVARLMHKQPDARYPDAGAVIADLCAVFALPLPAETDP